MHDGLNATPDAGGGANFLHIELNDVVIGVEPTVAVSAWFSLLQMGSVWELCKYFRLKNVK